MFTQKPITFPKQDCTPECTPASMVISTGGCPGCLPMSRVCVCLGGCSLHAGIHPLPVDRQTPVKILPCPILRLGAVKNQTNSFPVLFSKD